MLKNLQTNKILWTITTSLTLIVATIGVILPHIYDGLFAKEFIPGALPQDILTIFVCFIMFYLIAKTKEDSVKIQIFIISIIGSFFYLYGIYTIERVYNFFYIFYAGIFAMSFWSILYGLMNLKEEIFSKIKLSTTIIRTTAITGLIIASLFTLLWISALIPIMREHNQIDHLYSIYILDLCFIMPAFFITSIMSFKKKVIGIIFAPAIFIVGFFVIFPLGLGEMIKPFYGQVTDYKTMAISFIFSILMISIAFLGLNKIKISK